MADVEDANLAAAETDVPPGNVVNIAGGSETTVTDFIEMAEDLTKHSY